MIRWQLRDLDTNEVYTMRRNPREMSTPSNPKRIQTHQGHLRTGFRQGELPTNFTFRGRVNDEATYNALLGWSQRRRVEITDHRGRVHEIMPTAFDPTPRRSGRHDMAWTFDYTFTALYIRRVV